MTDPHHGNGLSVSGPGGLRVEAWGRSAVMAAGFLIGIGVIVYVLHFGLERNAKAIESQTVVIAGTAEQARQTTLAIYEMTDAINKVLATPQPDRRIPYRRPERADRLREPQAR